MSLKVEQILHESFIAENEPAIYTMGAYLIPLKINNGHESKFVWVVDRFNDDSYSSEGNYCSPNVYAKTIDELFNEKADDI